MHSKRFIVALQLKLILAIKVLICKCLKKIAGFGSFVKILWTAYWSFYNFKHLVHSRTWVAIVHLCNFRQTRAPVQSSFFFFFFKTWLLRLQWIYITNLVELYLKTCWNYFIMLDSFYIEVLYSIFYDGLLSNRRSLDSTKLYSWLSTRAFPITCKNNYCLCIHLFDFLFRT